MREAAFVAHCLLSVRDGSISLIGRAGSAIKAGLVKEWLLVYGLDFCSVVSL